MKVIVRCVNNRVTKSEMEQIIESLFQENKDLRVQVGHLRDELNLVRQQSEARRQVICERDKLIQELNDQIAADEEELLGQTEKLKTKIANVGAERDNFEAAYKQVLQWWEAAQSKVIEAEAAADEYRIAAMESDCRVDECEKRMDWLSKEVLEWKATAEGYKNQYEELKAQKEADDKKSEEICTACNERYEDVLSERNRLREEVARLTNERDAAVNENTEMMFEINELQDKWEAEHNLRVEAEKERDMYRSSAETWRAEHDKVVADVALYREKAKKYLEERDLAWDANKRMEGNEETITYYQEIADHRKEKLDEAMRTITSLNDDIHKLEETIDGLNEDKRAYGEEIDRLRKVVTELQTNRSLTNEIHEMLYKYLTTVNTPSADKLDF